MVEARRFHSNFLFLIPLTQGVLLVIVLDFCKNAVFFSDQVQNLSPSTSTTASNGQMMMKPKDPAYLAAQYIYAIWLVMMMLKAIVELRANLNFDVRWMGRYNLLLGIDTGFEFIHTTLSIVFQDMSQLDEAAIIRRYCVSYLILILQLYGCFCCWIHLKWVIFEMPNLLTTGLPPQSFLELMFPGVRFPLTRGDGRGGMAAAAAAATTSEISTEAVGAVVAVAAESTETPATITSGGPDPIRPSSALASSASSHSLSPLPPATTSINPALNRLSGTDNEIQVVVES